MTVHMSTLEKLMKSQAIIIKKSPSTHYITNIPKICKHLQINMTQTYNSDQKNHNQTHIHNIHSTHYSSEKLHSSNQGIFNTFHSHYMCKFQPMTWPPASSTTRSNYNHMCHYTHINTTSSTITSTHDTCPNKAI